MDATDLDRENRRLGWWTTTNPFAPHSALWCGRPAIIALSFRPQRNSCLRAAGKQTVWCWMSVCPGLRA